MLTLKEHRRYGDHYVVRVAEVVAVREANDRVGEAGSASERTEAVREREQAKARTGLPLDNEGVAVFEFAVDPPEGVSRADYEKQQQVEAARLVESAAERAQKAELAGQKVTGEGQSIALG